MIEKFIMLTPLEVISTLEVSGEQIN
jgi:hypothetical protein